MKKFITTMVNGLLFAIPLGVVILLFSKLLLSLEKLVEPVADLMGIQRFLGQFALTIVSVGLILVFCFALGYLLQRAIFLRTVGEAVEGFAVRVIPSLSFLKSMADETFDLQGEHSWKGILLEDDGSWLPAFLIEETPQWQTVFIPEAPKGDGGEVRIFATGTIKFTVIELGQVRAGLRVYGYGLSKLLK
jgi:uncharacterized membrane protein